MTETFTLKESTTFKEFLILTYYQTFRIRRLKAIFSFVVIVCILSAILEVAITKHVNWFKVIFLNLLMTPLFLIAFVYVVGLIIAILLKKFKPSLFNITNKFTHWGMERTSEGFEVAIPWSKFLKYRETKKYILLYITRDHSYIIQKKFFDSDEQLEDFRHLLSEKIQP